jgi:hypothetical protein
MKSVLVALLFLATLPAQANDPCRRYFELSRQAERRGERLPENLARELNAACYQHLLEAERRLRESTIPAPSLPAPDRWEEADRRNKERAERNLHCYLSKRGRYCYPR